MTFDNRIPEADQRKAEIDRPFVNLVSNRVVEGQRDYLRLLRSLGEE